MNINILHIGDLHISKKSIKDIRFVRDALFQDLAKFKEKDGLSPDFILFTGDLVNKGENSKEEFKYADEEFIKPLLKHIGLSSDLFFIAPGNHEVDRKRTSEAFENGLQTKLNTIDSFVEYYNNLNQNKTDLPFLKYKLDGFSKYISSLNNNNKVAGNYFYRVYRTTLNKISIGIICMNSAWLSSQFGSDKGKLILGEEIFLEANEFIKSDDLKIVIAHHPFEMLKEWDVKSLKNTFSRNIDLFLTGHIHDSDFEYSQPIYGSLYVSTCASLYSGRIANGYSFVNIDLTNKTLNIFLRKYYDKRKEFDQETEKCENGLISYKEFKCNSKNADYLITLNYLKTKLYDYQNSLPVNIVHPFDGLADIKLNDVFVDPIISNISTFEGPITHSNHIKLDTIIKDSKNCIFYGRKEFGKTTLLKYIYDKILSDHKYFESKIPFLLDFNNLQKNNYKSITTLIRKQFENLCEKENIEEFIEKGDLVFIIDDYDDYNAIDREDKKNIFYQLLTNYPNCRFIISINELFAQKYKSKTVDLYKLGDFKSYYLASLNTSRIRQILEKWRPYNNFDTEGMLRQIVFYFQQLRIPITPMAVTLFMGVLIRENTQKNINNEAYLIENYLESLLEKLDPIDLKQPLDFREKESFLAHIAYRMYEQNIFELDKNDFEKEKLDYFINLDEDLPEHEVFDVFFKKGILINANNKISFKFRFLFFFFLAKSFQKDRTRLDKLLQSKIFLKYSSALAYQAGLDRGDLELLKSIDSKTQDYFNSFFSQHSNKQLEDLEIEDGLIKYSEEIEKDIIKKNKSEEKDELRDHKYLSYDDQDQSIDPTIEEDEEYDDIIQLVTLNSDIIRNTREIPTAEKSKFISNNILAYKSLMWHTIEIFQEIIERIDKESLKKFLFELNNDKLKNMNIDEILKKMKEITFQIIPASIIMYMSEHLMNYRFKNTLHKLAQNEVILTNKLFYLLLLYKSDSSTLSNLSSFVDEINSFILDQLIFVFLMVHCIENKLDSCEVEQVLEVLEKIRKKNAKSSKQLPVYIKDTFREDIKRKIELNKLKD